MIVNFLIYNKNGQELRYDVVGVTHTISDKCQRNIG